MESRNPLIKFVIYGKLKRIMMSYLGDKTRNVDKNLMRGIFLRKINDFDEEVKEILENKTLLTRLHGDLFSKKEILRRKNSSKLTNSYQRKISSKDVS